MSEFLDITTIDSKADALRRKHAGDGLPVNPIVIAEALGVPVRRGTFDNPQIAGMLQCTAGRNTIWVRSDDPTTRMRFTVAHELGHLQLHDAAERFITYDYVLYRQEQKGEAGFDRREYQANAFAASLLMPERFVRAEFEENANILSMAERFAVSEQAMVYRLKKLGLIDA